MSVDVSTRHPSVKEINKYFSYEHLTREDLRLISAHCSDLKDFMIEHLKDSPELTAGLRKLLEAKDCFVRAAL